MDDGCGDAKPPRLELKLENQVTRSGFSASADVVPVTSPVLATPALPAQVTINYVSPSTIDCLSNASKDRRRVIDGQDSGSDSVPSTVAHQSRLSSASLSVELLVVALEEENERLRSMLASERCARVLAEAELSAEAARARELEVKLLDTNSLLKECQKQLIELQHEAYTKAFVRSWMASVTAQPQEEDTDSEAAASVPETQTPEPRGRGSLASAGPAAAAISSAGQAVVGLASNDMPVCATAAIRINSRVAESWSLTTNSYRSREVYLGFQNAQAGTRDTDEGGIIDDASLGTCLHASDLDLDVDLDRESETSGRETSGPYCTQPELPLICNTATSGEGTVTSYGCALGQHKSAAAATPFLPLAQGLGYGRLHSDGGVEHSDAWAPRQHAGVLQRAHTTGGRPQACEVPVWGLQQHGELARQTPLLFSTPPSSEVMEVQPERASVLPPSTPWQGTMATAFPMLGCQAPSPASHGLLLSSPSSLPPVHIRPSRASSMKALVSSGLSMMGSFGVASLRSIHVDQPAWELVAAAANDVAAAPYGAAIGNEGRERGTNVTAGAAATTSCLGCGPEEVGALGGPPDVANEWSNIPLGSPICAPVKSARIEAHTGPA